MLVGAVHEVVAEVMEATLAVSAVGAPGAPTMVMALDGGEAGLVPIPLVAVTVKVYEVPRVSPVTVQVVAPVVEHV